MRRRVTLVLIVFSLLFAFASATAVSYRASDFSDLEYGDSGESVRALQTRLKALGYYTGKIDSCYGNSTGDALEAFADQNDLEYKYYAAPELQAALFSDDAIAADGKRTDSYDNQEDPVNTAYVANSSTGIYHHSSCRYVKRMKDENKVPTTKQEAIDAGYRGCKVCKP